MLPNETDDGNMSPAGIVQIRKAVGESRTQMQESACRLFGHARVTISGPGDYTFKKAEHAAHFRQMVEGRDEVDLRGPGVCEASFHSTGYEGSSQTLCAIHQFGRLDSSFVRRRCALAGR
jgi:hypothetical protein